MPVLLRLLGSAALGVALSAAFDPLDWWFVAPLALAGLWVVLDGRTVRGGLGYGWIFGIAFMGSHVWWVYLSAGLAPALVLPVILGAFYALFGAAFALVSRSRLGDRLLTRVAAFAILWMGGETFRGMWPYGGFPWGRVAFSQVDVPTVDYAWLGGASLVSFVVALAGALIGAAIKSEAGIIGRPAMALSALVLWLVVPFAIPVTSLERTDTITVGVVQGNVPVRDGSESITAYTTLQKHADETYRLLEQGDDLDLIVWPEDSADRDPRADARTAEIVGDVAAAAGVPILVGTTDFTPEEGRLNTSLLIDADGTPLGGYSKQRPVPFGEFVPLRDWVTRLSDKVGRVPVDMIAGTEPAALDAPIASLERDVTLGIAICFEVSYDDILTEAASLGAEMLVVPTNNELFGYSAESTQQLAMTKMRAIETGRYAIQVATMGVSAFVTPQGVVSHETELYTADSFAVEVPLVTGDTPAMQVSEALTWLWLLLSGAMIVGALLRGRGERE